MRKSENTNEIENDQKNKLKLWHFELSTRSIIIVYVALFLLFFSFVTFCVSSCTKQIAIQYIKQMKSNNTNLVTPPINNTNTDKK